MPATDAKGYDWGGFLVTDPLNEQPPLSPSAFGKQLLAVDDASGALTLLGISALAIPDPTGQGGNFLTTDGVNLSWSPAAGGGGGTWGSITGALSSQSDLNTALGNKQPLDSDLTAIAALTTTSFGRSFLDRADAAAGRTLLGLSTLSTTTPASGVATFLATPTSANLRAALTDENGTGAALFNNATSPKFLNIFTVQNGNAQFLIDVTSLTNDNVQFDLYGVGGSQAFNVNGRGQVLLADGDAVGGHYLLLNPPAVTANRSQSWADASGTVALTTNSTGVVDLTHGGTNATTAGGALTNLGGTTVGAAMFGLTNPSAITFPRFNADNTVSALSASAFRTAIGAGTSSFSGLFTGLDFTSSNLTSIATRNFSDLQNIPHIGTYTYFIRLIAGTPTAFDASGIQVSSNADTGALVNALMPTLSVNPTGALFAFDRAAFPFASAITHNTPTIKDDFGNVTQLAPVVLRGAGANVAADSTEPLKQLNTIFYPTSSFSPSGGYLVNVNASATGSRAIRSFVMEGIAVVCTTDGAATNQSDSPPYGVAASKCAGVSVINPGAGYIRNVAVGSPLGNGIAITTTDTGSGVGSAFRVFDSFVNAVQGSGHYAFIVTLDDCELSHSFAYFTSAGSTDFKIGSGASQPVRLTGCDSNANNGGTVLELAGSASVNGLTAHGDGVWPAIWIKKTGTGNVSMSGSVFQNPRPSASGGTVVYQLSGSSGGSVMISGCSFSGLDSGSTLVKQTSNADPTESLYFGPNDIQVTSDPVIYTSGGFTQYAAGQLRYGPFNSNSTPLFGLTRTNGNLIANYQSTGSGNAQIVFDSDRNTNLTFRHSGVDKWYVGNDYTNDRYRWSDGTNEVATLFQAGGLSINNSGYNPGLGNLSLGGLTASQYVKTDGSKVLVSASGVPVGDISGLGTGVATALGINVGSAGAFVTFNGALGTPTSGTLTNCSFPTLNQNTTGSAASLSATLAVASGGTNLTSYAVGDLLYASGATTLSKLADVATGNALISGGVTTAPSWGKITTSHTTGIAASGSNSDITALSGITGTITSAQGTISANTAALAITQTWNNSGVSFVPFTITATDTASTGVATAFANFKLGSTSNFSVNKNGIVMAGTGFGVGTSVGAPSVMYLISDRLYHATNGADMYIGSTGLNNYVQVAGTTTNNNAAAGYRGEYVESLIAAGSATSLTTATAKNITSISLTAGDWDVEGIVNFTETTSTVTARSAGISSTSATLPTDGSEGYCGVQSTVTSETNSITLARKRISIASTTTVYLVGSATFSAGTCAGFGAITARRVR